MNLNLPCNKAIASLRIAAKRIEKDPKYSWNDAESCNMGTLVQVSLGLDPHRVMDAMKETYDKRYYGDYMFKNGDAPWGNVCNAICSTTGKPVFVVVQKLIAMGFDRADLAGIESLRDKAVLARLSAKGATELRQNVAADVAAYFRELALIYAERQAAQVSVAPKAITSAIASPGIEQIAAT